MKALTCHVTGIVQGVGFRPFVYTLAREHHLSGWVLNATDGVHCLVEGDATSVDLFITELASRAPAMALIEGIHAEEIEPTGAEGFEVLDSVQEPGAMTLVSPDIATCPACLGEISDQADRRHGYPFTNCTNCGPRFTIIDDVPYDRSSTAMRDFPMCEQCAAEYADPADRRFHAQPNACFTCGPRLYLNERGAEGEFSWTAATDVTPRPHRDAESERLRAQTIVQRVADLLDRGAIVAVKGLGGFHLACDATNEAAVQKLRERKHRWAKPLAVMVGSVESARVHCHVDEVEAGLLEGTVRPIVLLRRGRPRPATSGVERALAQGVADGLAEVGIVLPYTPLHHLLMDAFGRPLVMTSGNLSEEPIATDNAEALERLKDIADAFLLHDREIRARYDDSVVRVVGGVVEPVRRARGLAPHPLRTPFLTDVSILAAGPEQKNTFTLLKDDYAFVSQHIGDLENAETLASFEETIRLYERLFRVEPRIVAHDLHPEYLSTKWALATGLPTMGVQHHHAHIASVAAEHGVEDQVIGAAFDGTGYGADGRIWGGEFLLADWRDYRRIAHLRYVPMPGGAAAIRRPARMALGALAATSLLGHPGCRPLISRLAENEEQTLLTMVANGVNSPLTSSMGRLFDAVAAIAGVADDANYEGEAAILLEACADAQAEGAYQFGLPAPIALDEPSVIDIEPVLRGVADDVASGVGAPVIAMRFHRAVVECIVSACEAASQATGITTVALAGGVFMNRIVLGEAVRRLSEVGLTPITHVALPMNDAAVSFGQAVVAWANRRDI